MPTLKQGQKPTNFIQLQNIHPLGSSHQDPVSGLRHRVKHSPPLICRASMSGFALSLRNAKVFSDPGFQLHYPLEQ